MENRENKSLVSIRFSDLDPYRHVNSSRYFDLVRSALLETDIKPIISTLEINFKRPITEVAPVLVQTKTQLEEHGPTVIDYQILSADGKTAFSDGKINALEEPSNLSNGPTSTPFGKPISYDWEIDVRYNDLDSLNHVDLSQYLDYISTGRWHFLENQFQMQAEDFVKKGVGFFMTRAEMAFKKSIIGASRVSVRSWISEVRREGTELVVPYQMVGKDGSFYSNGVLYFSVIDFTSGRPKRGPMPEWAFKFFFEKSGEKK